MAEVVAEVVVEDGVRERVVVVDGKEEGFALTRLKRSWNLPGQKRGVIE